MTEEAEFQEIYNLDVISIPTNKPTVRQDQNDVIYKNENAKFNAIVQSVKQSHEKGQPVLVGTVSIEKSEKLSRALGREGMKVLVLNCGSSSLKCQLIDMETEERIMKGHYDRIGGSRSSLRFNVRGNKVEFEHPARNFEEAISFILNLLVDKEYNVVDSLDEIGAIGHRIVHGGENFTESVVIDKDVEAAIN